MPAKPLPGGRTVFRGAYYGLIAWMAYATLEFVLAAAAPLRSYNNTILASWYWPLTATLWSVYAAAGLVFGAGAGYAAALLVPAAREAHPLSRRLIETAATATLALAFTVNLWTVAVFDIAGVICAALILAGLAAALLSKAWRARCGILANPWITAALLLLSSRFSAGLHDRGLVRILTPFLLAAAVFAASGIARRLSFAQAAGSRPLLAGVALIAATAVVLGGTQYMNRGLAPRRAQAATASAGISVPVVLISMDTVRADHLSLYGYARNTAPNLARFAATATLYRRAVAAADMTLPAHAAMFTGMYASWNGAHFDAPAHTEPLPLSKKYRTLAEILAAHGYLTISIAANFSYFQPEFGFDRGFAVFDCPSPIAFLSYDRDYYLRFGVRKLLNQVGSTADFDLKTRRAAEINEAIANSLRRDWTAGRPVFVFANYMDAHDPYVAPPPFDAMFPGSTLRLTNHEYYELADDVAGLKRTVAPAVRDHLIARYDSSIAYLDSELGRLFARLKEIGLYDEALIVVTADHGEAFGDKNFLGHGVSVYQDQIGVPLIVKYPRQRSGRSVEEPVSHIDLLPTILDVLGYPPPAYVQGRSLLKIDGRSRTDLVSESFAQSKFIESHPRFNRVERALIEGDRKLVWSTAGKREVYDLAADPGERRNVCASDAAACAALEQRLQAWSAGIPRAEGPARKLDKQSLDRLRSLGYIQ